MLRVAVFNVDKLLADDTMPESVAPTWNTWQHECNDSGKVDSCLKANVAMATLNGKHQVMGVVCDRVW